jgi:soluble lytic murein transglycosylase
MQITPGAVEQLRNTGALGKNESPDLSNPQQNIRVGTLYMNYLLGRFGEDVRQSVAAYTAGEGRVSARYKDGYVQPKDQFPNSNRYIDKVMACLKAANDPGVVACPECP